MAQANDISLQPAEQLARWNRYLRQVEKACNNTDCYIIGDFNLDYQRWNRPDPNHINMIASSKNSLEANGFSQLVQGITRTWPGQVDSQIDHIWTNAAEKIIETTNEVKATGDHNLISMILRTKTKNPNRLETRKRTYRNLDITDYKQKLSEVNWTEIQEIENVDEANYFLESNLTKILDVVCPFKTIQYRKNYKPWISAQTLAQMEARDKIREEARISGEPASWKKYRSIRNKVNSNIDKDRKAHFSKIYTNHLENKDAKATFKTAKDQAGWKNTATPVTFKVDGEIITAPLKLGETQMEAFYKKTENLIKNLPQATTDPLATLQQSLDNWGDKKSERDILKFHPITNIETLNLIRKLGNNTSTAHDNLDALMVKLGVQYLHAPIKHIINMSISKSTFVSRWKVGQILPLHKGKGLDKMDPNSYRPITLLPILGKLTEKALQMQVMEFMDKTEQWNRNHHAYRKNHSTLTAMLQLSDTIFEACNNNQITTAVTLDQSAAFDMLEHDILLAKLSMYNFGQEVVNWFRSYLSF